MNTVFTKLKDFVGLNEAEDYDYDYAESDGNDYAAYSEETAPAMDVEDRSSRRRLRERATSSESSRAAASVAASRSNVIGMPGVNASMFEVIVIEPRSFEKMPQVIQALRERKSVVLNLTMMDPEEAQRAVDFVAGATYAIDGHQERVGESIFLFTPNCVQVTTQTGVVHEVAPPLQRDPTRSPLAGPPTSAWASEAHSIAQ
ncbi:hypothetical protein KR51_00031310 [Rubidibacter lacunae KORDI 51-2]|uniref:Cell division protein SepF n=1 Tax=Rubidibacter lacunae KORDI 51-2 TaxID=582515 RepID=U5DHW1_9CHRO|nr:cell division protein SepF [Rubidibacter lacunae]ERN40194.1 hypothetical protein KR51_00031310 [Rubidibacter lacunae KORDI 51-2]